MTLIFTLLTLALTTSTALDDQSKTRSLDYSPVPPHHPLLEASCFPNVGGTRCPFSPLLDIILFTTPSSPPPSIRKLPSGIEAGTSQMICGVWREKLQCGELEGQLCIHSTALKEA